MGGDAALLQTYERVILEVSEYKYYYISAEVGKLAFPHISEFPMLMVFGATAATIKPENLTAAEWEDHMHKLMYPPVAMITERNTALFFSGGRKAVVLFVDPDRDDLWTLLVEFERLALRHYSTKYVFLYASMDKEWGRHMTNYLKIGYGTNPRVEVLWRNSSSQALQRFVYPEGNIRVDPMDEFLAKVEAGAMAPFYRSESSPESNPGPLFRVVGSTFRSEVLQSGLDVLVVVYSDGCMDCKIALESAKMLAKIVQPNRGLKIVIVNGEENDLEGVEVVYFPTILLYPAKRPSSPILYTGPRSVEAFARFIGENCDNPLTLPEFTFKGDELHL